MKLKIKYILIVLLFIIFTFAQSGVLAYGVRIKSAEYTEDYQRWLELSPEEKENTFRPEIYKIPKSKSKYDNPLRLTRLVGGGSDTSYSLIDDISENVVVRDQEDTDLCWAFASLSSLETNLALRNLKNNKENKVYDFSEKHMDYATTYTLYDFDNETVLKTNIYGLNRQIKGTGRAEYAISYLTNGMGAVSEEEVPFDYENIDIDDIFSHTGETQVKDIIIYPQYKPTDEGIDSLITQMKDHIKNYGSLGAYVFAPEWIESEVYNQATGAMYCSNDVTTPYDHAVSIVGWDDEYSIDNFNEKSKPSKKGAWIIKNSWGEKKFVFSMDEIKDYLFEHMFTEEERTSQGWTTSEDIPDVVIDQVIENLGWIREEEGVYVPVGKNGFMYISYEDINIYKHLFGIVNATDEPEYEYLYQYNEASSEGRIGIDGTNQAILANKFEKQSEGDEYITEVSIFAAEEYTCKVYVNANDDSLDKDKLKPVTLKTGETETIKAGYHTLEFAEPVKIESEGGFVVAVEIVGTHDNLLIAVESVIRDENTNEVLEEYKNIKTETGKCFICSGESDWVDITPETEEEGDPADSTIKVFTVSSIPDNSIDRIEVTKEPNKKDGYKAGDDFDPEGMEITAFYNNGEENVVTATEYEMSGNENLKAGENVITITYKGKDTTVTVTAEGTVSEAIKSIEITHAPDKTEYFEGEPFNPEGMIVSAVYENGDKEVIEDYFYEDESVLDALEYGQTDIVIVYGELEATQKITVKKADSNIVDISIKVQPKKINYYEGENFDSTEMVVVAVYENGEEVELTDEQYTIENKDNLQAGQTSVTIRYQTFHKDLLIVVEENEMTGIDIKTQPNKIEYFEGEDFDPQGMVVVAVYKNGAKEEITDYELGDNTSLRADQPGVVISYGEFTVLQLITVNTTSIDRIIIKTEPNKTEYKLYEDFDPEGMVVIAISSDGSEKTLDDDEYEIIDGDSLLEDQEYVTISYQGKEAKQKVTVKPSVKKPVGSNLEYLTESTNMVKAYYYVNKSGDDYVLIDMEISNIEQDSGNDGYEYYYYFSDKVSEDNIDSWIKIDGAEVRNGTLSFTADSRKMTNYEKIEDADKLYVYIKEVAIKGDEKVGTVSQAVRIQTESVPAEVYVDDVIKKEYEDVKTEKEKEKQPATTQDKTLADRVFPNTGSKVAFILIIGLAIFTTVRYVKYRKLREIK